MSLEIKISELGQKDSRPMYRVDLIGEASIYSISEWQERLNSILQKNPLRLEIDAGGLEKVDSSFLQSLLLLKRESLAMSWDLSISNHSHSLLEFLDLYGLIGYFQDRIRISKKDSSSLKFAYGLEKA
ncbi:STAS domain-containing protein [Leptospira langatensis]|uniref:STAS domain-containing protein n=1 Tax=Leptospira langatensis TaxID=2484983 RepID=A0A5F1ZXV6_9LEPT|nr:STAS domain-containing protein [Leptospira langatensis]TGK04215.1 STAS domain-containing protein [Leptospira langatensis]TGL43695.1 STAS domain-containing protein [Leptospira langatensis]